MSTTQRPVAADGIHDEGHGNGVCDVRRFCYSASGAVIHHAAYAAQSIKDDCSGVASSRERSGLLAVGQVSSILGDPR